jgi:hypothetical protein
MWNEKMRHVLIAVTVVLNEDRWKSYKEYEVHRRNHVSLEEIRFRWIESGFVGRNPVLLVGIRLCWKESGFVGKNQVSLVALRIWYDDGTIRNELGVAYIVWLGLDVLWNE